jgi:hypothetical protein
MLAFLFSGQMIGEKNMQKNRHNGGRGKTRQPDALRNSGWRPPLIEGRYQDLVLNISQRPEFKGKTLRAVIQAAIMELATHEEMAEVGWELELDL